MRRSFSVSSKSKSNFNPRTPYGMRPTMPSALNPLFLYFNPRTPYGMRLNIVFSGSCDPDFNPRTPYGMRRVFFMLSSHHAIFQSTHPLRDATYLNLVMSLAETRFQSTHPLRDATWDVRHRQERQSNFNPRTPYGMRPLDPSEVARQTNFNPRTPYGMRQGGKLQQSIGGVISIHAPLTGCDRGARGNITRLIQISIHAPLTGCDWVKPFNAWLVNISIHAPLTGCDTGLHQAFTRFIISIHAPLTGCDKGFFP